MELDGFMEVCICGQLQMRFLPKSKSHDSEGSVSSDACGPATGTTGTARARIARYGARHTHSQSSPSHRDHAAGPSTDEWAGLSDDEEDEDDDDNDDDDDGDDVDVDDAGQSSRLLVSFDDSNLKDTRV